MHIVMELLRGGDLFDRIVEKGRYSEASARKIMWKILSAVSYLHSHNIIHRCGSGSSHVAVVGKHCGLILNHNPCMLTAHRDLKPENILLVSSHDDTEVRGTPLCCVCCTWFS